MNTYISLILSPFLTFLALPTHAQVTDWQWAQAGGGTDWDFGNDVATDLQGNVYVTGYFASPSITIGNVILDNSESYYEDIFVVKYDSSGNVMWANKAGGTLSDAGQAIITDDEGNVYVTGYFQSTSITFDNIVVNNTGNYNIFLVKYNALGDLQWVKNSKTVSTGYPYNDCKGLTIDATGNIYLSGAFQASSISFDSFILDNAGSETSDMFVAKYDVSGNVIWARSASGGNEDGSEGIVADALGYVIVTGYFNSGSIIFGNDTLNNSGNLTTDMFIVKYDSDGKVIWINQGSGTTNNDYGHDVATDEGNNIYVTGAFYSDQITFDNFSISNSQAGGYSDMFLVKYNAAGNVEWVQKTYCTSNDYAHSVATDKADGVYVNGWFDGSMTSDSITLTSANASTDIFIAKYHKSGNFIWLMQGNGYGPDYSYSLAVDKNKNVFITGGFASDTLQFGNISVPNSFSDSSTYYYDMFLAKYSSNCVNVFYADFDGDQFGNSDSGIIACAAPNDFTTDSTDCDDTNATIYPGATDIPDNGIDEDCNGADEMGTGIQVYKSASALALYPNPSNGKFIIDFAGYTKTSATGFLEIQNMIGEIVYSEHIMISNGKLKEEMQIDPSFPEGIYIVTIVTDQKSLSRPIIYQR